MGQSIAHEGYIPVSIATLIPQKDIGVPLYLQESADQPVRLYRGADVPLEETDLQKLLSRGLTRLFVATSQHAEYQAYLRENLDDVLADESLPVEKRFGALNEVVRDVLATSFGQKDTDATVERSRAFAQRSVELICRSDVSASDLLSVMYHDYHTFTHSANVSYYCVMLAKALQLGDAETLQQIATGALLHDLGKLEIPDSILCKPGRLDETEFEIIKRHPRAGFLTLCRRGDLSFGQLMMVYQHHERLDGKGYPVGLVADEIHSWARLCSVADVFEALTSNRPYRSGMPIAEAFSILDRDSGLAFDEEMVQCWKATISPT